MIVKFLYIIFVLFSFSDGKVIKKFFDNNECNLDETLIEEIWSYKNITKRIMEEIIVRDFGERMYTEYTKFIDKFGPRPSGTSVLEDSIDHMINLTKHFGLQDVITEGVEVPQWFRGFESATMLQPRIQEINILGLGTSVSTSAEGITAEAIVVKNFKELKELDNSKVTGKIIVYDVPFVSYGETVKYRSQGASKAAAKGAVASLIRSITPFSIYSPHTGAQYYDANVTKIPTACITLEDADLLHRLQKAGEKIVINLKMLNKSKTKRSRNTIIDFKGKQNPEKLVIVSGHIDSWDVGQGAMDDGGGMMISWFVPVILNLLNVRPKRTVRAILWTSEEPGLVGAAAYLNQHIDEISNINIIMESDEGTFKPLGLSVGGSKTALCVISEVLKLFSPVDKLVYESSPGSDITLFVNKGVPGASLINENERYYWFHHSAGDTLNVQNKPDVIECAAFWAAVSYVLADLSTDIPKT